MAKFDFLRVSLSKPEAPLLDDVLKEEISRKEFFTAALSKQHEFAHHKRNFVYVPLANEGDLFVGVLSKHSTESINAGPDSKFEPVDVDKWNIAFLFFDVRDEKQIAVVQQNGKVSTSTKYILESFFKTLSRQPPFSLWRPHVEYIASAKDFWAVAKEYAGKITALQFTFIPPNALRASEAVDELVRAASKEANSESVDMILRNPDGHLKPEGQLVESAVTTATRGGGEIKAKAGKKTIYSSTKNKVVEEIPNQDVPKPSLLQRVLRLGKRMLNYD